MLNKSSDMPLARGGLAPSLRFGRAPVHRPALHDPPLSRVLHSEQNDMVLAKQSGHESLLKVAEPRTGEGPGLSHRLPTGLMKLHQLLKNLLRHGGRFGPFDVQITILAQAASQVLSRTAAQTVQDFLRIFTRVMQIEIPAGPNTHVPIQSRSLSPKLGIH